MSSMMMVKVERSVRDDLRALTSERGVIIDIVFRELLEEAARERCSAEVRRTMRTHPPGETHLKKLYERESEVWS